MADVRNRNKLATVMFSGPTFYSESEDDCDMLRSSFGANSSFSEASTGVPTSPRNGDARPGGGHALVARKSLEGRAHSSGGSPIPSSGALGRSWERMCTEIRSLGIDVNLAAVDIEARAPRPAALLAMMRAMQALLQLTATDAAERDAVAAEVQRLRNDAKLANSAKEDMRERVVKLERDLGLAKNRHSAESKRWMEHLNMIEEENAALSKQATDLQRRHAQFQHEIRKKEKEYTTLQDRLRRHLAERKSDADRARLEVAGILKAAAKGRPVKRMDEDMYKVVVQAYEAKQKSLGRENNALKARLRGLEEDYKAAVNMLEDLASLKEHINAPAVASPSPQQPEPRTPQKAGSSGNNLDTSAPAASPSTATNDHQGAQMSSPAPKPRTPAAPPSGAAEVETLKMGYAELRSRVRSFAAGASTPRPAELKTPLERQLHLELMSAQAIMQQQQRHLDRTLAALDQAHRRRVEIENLNANHANMVAQMDGKCAQAESLTRQLNERLVAMETVATQAALDRERSEAELHAMRENIASLEKKAFSQGREESLSAAKEQLAAMEDRTAKAEAERQQMETMQRRIEEALANVKSERAGMEAEMAAKTEEFHAMREKLESEHAALAAELDAKNKEFLRAREELADSKLKLEDDALRAQEYTAVRTKLEQQLKEEQSRAKQAQRQAILVRNTTIKRVQVIEQEMAQVNEKKREVELEQQAFQETLKEWAPGFGAGVFLEKALSRKRTERLESMKGERGDSTTPSREEMVRRKVSLDLQDKDSDGEVHLQDDGLSDDESLSPVPSVGDLSPPPTAGHGNFNSNYNSNDNSSDRSSIMVSRNASPPPNQGLEEMGSGGFKTSSNPMFG